MAETSKFSYHVDHDLHRLVTACVGTLLSEDIAAHFEQRESMAVLGYDQLADLTNARLSVNTAQVQRLAKAMLGKAQACRLGRTAILVSDDVSFGMARMFGTMVSPEYAVNVFRSHADAREWLGWTRSRVKRVAAVDHV